ncbi:MAG: hypothetical protein V3S31_07180 [Dehalococcoidia bacterium]
MRLTLLLMAVYLAAMALLATQVDQRFFVNDAMAIVIFGVLFAGVVLAARRPGARRPR